MTSLFLILLTTLIEFHSTEGLINPAPVVFGDVGTDVTIRSRLNEESNFFSYISWYLQRPSGKVERLAYFGSFTTKFGRYSGELPKGFGGAYLNISNATTGDSGRYFVVVGSALKLTPGSASVLVITDPKALPEMRVYLSRSGAVQCELKGGGPAWNDPYWEIYDTGDVPNLLQSKAETMVDEQGTFIRSSILSLNDTIRSLNCVCRHSTGVIIRTQIKKENAIGKHQCQLAQYLLPLALLLLLVTVIASGLWACRQRRRSRP
ncbi:hypothetical protein GJAV_G00007350 [Gymnothorax javanicus]|nr:hypothetical protein GJAV_G00007350 [Gymnothorax javanicus]